MSRRITITRSPISLPERDVVIVCKDAILNSALYECFPCWHYITSSLSDGDLLLLSRFVKMLVVVGSGAHVDLERLIGKSRIGEMRIIFTTVDLTKSHEVLDAICSVYYNK